MRLRDREEINASILTTAGSGYGAKLTKLMFSSYLTHSQVLQYSKTLIERGFLDTIESIKCLRRHHLALDFSNCMAK